MHIEHIRRLVQSMSEAREKESWSDVATLASMITERANDIYLLAQGAQTRRPK